MMTAFLNRLPLRVKDTLFLLFFTICCAMYSLWAGQDVNWDILNYHLYIPYAFLNGRFLTDVMPAGIHTFLNPVRCAVLLDGIVFKQLSKTYCISARLLGRSFNLDRL